MEYDAIVVGSRVAGSPTAMLLARRGLRVLLLDKARFPSDVISTHLLHPRGTSYLNRWGLLRRLLDAPTPSWTVHSAVLQGIRLSGAPTIEMVRKRLTQAHSWRRQDELGAATITYCAPRRTVLDKILLDAAADAGAEVREGFSVEDLVMDGDVVKGVQGRSRTSDSIVERARIVVGADGRHSLVARRVKAPVYSEKLRCTYCYYSYWDAVDTSGLVVPSLYVSGRVGAGAVRSSDGALSMFTFGPREWFHSFRSDIDRNFMKSIDHIYPALAERVRAGKRVERYYGTADQPAFFRKPFGPGWALVGDSAYQKDQVTASAMGHAFRDAELLSEAIAAGLSGARPLEEALEAYERRRNEDSMTYYDHVTKVAECRPPALEDMKFLAALRGNQPKIDAFIAMQGDTMRTEEFFSPEHTQQIRDEARADLDVPAIVARYRELSATFEVLPWTADLPKGELGP